MADQKIIKFIKLQLQQGFDGGAIKSNLIMEGYPEADIDDAFSNLDSFELEPEPLVPSEVERLASSEVEREPVIEVQEEISEPEQPIESENILESMPSIGSPVPLVEEQPTIEEKKTVELAKLAVKKKLASKQKIISQLPKDFRKRIFIIIGLNLTALFLAGVIWVYYYL